MKKFLAILLIAIAGFVLVARYNNDPRHLIPRIINEDLLLAGKLTYKINFLSFLPVAEATFYREAAEVYKGTEVYHLKATARSLKYLAGLFRGSATIDSYVDTKTLSPIFFKQELVSPGKERANKEVWYDQKNNTMTRDGERRLILPNTQDPLSLIYNIRKMDFEKTKEFEMSINTNQKNYVLKATAEIKNLVVNNKAFKLVLLKGDIRRRGKNPYHQTKITMVLLNEKGNLPILINVLASGMPINARLSGIK